MWRVWLGDRHAQRSRSFASRREAQVHADEMERLYEQRGVVAPAEQTVTEFIARYLHWREQQLAKSTLAGYRRNLDYLLRHVGAVPLRRLTPETLDIAYVTLRESGGKDDRPLHPRTVLHIHRAAHTAFVQAVKWRLLIVNPAAQATPPKVPPMRAIAPTMEQVERLIAAAGDRDPWPQLLILAVSTGLRRGELLGLPWRNIDLDAGWLTVEQVCEQAGREFGLRPLPKTKRSQRRIGLAPDVCTMLRAWRARLTEQALKLGLGWREDALVFPDLRDGSVAAPYAPDVISGYAASLKRRAALPAGVQALHGLRHRHASSLMHLPLKLVSDRLGHSSVRITADLYQHGDDAAARQIADAAGTAFGTLVQLAERPARATMAQRRRNRNSTPPG
jgi:integrase